MTREDILLKRRIKAKEDMLKSSRPETTPSQKDTQLYKQIQEEYNTARDRNTLDRLAVGTRGIGDNLILGLGNLSEGAIGQFTDAPLIKSQLEIDAQKNVDMEKNIQSFDDAIQGGGSNPAYGIPEMGAFIAPTARLGLIGSGLTGAAKTIGTHGAMDYGISKALNKSDEEAMQNAILAGIGMGGIYGARGAFRSLDSDAALRKNYDEGGSMAGGGTSKTRDMFEQQQARMDESELRTDGLQDIDAKQLRSKYQANDLDVEIKSIQDTLDKLEENPYKEIYRENRELFQDIDYKTAKGMMEDNKGLLATLKDELEASAFKRMDEIDFIKRGDDRIEIGAKEELYPNREPDSTLAEALAKEKADARTKELETLKAKQDNEITTRKQAGEDLKTATREQRIQDKYDLEEALKKYNENRTPDNLSVVDRLMNRIEPSRDDLYLIDKSKKIKLLDDDYSIGDVQPSKLDRGVTTVGVSSKSDNYINYDAFKDGRLGDTKDGQIRVRSNITPNDILVHISGKGDNLVSKQKLAVTNLMKEKYGVDLPAIVSKMTHAEAKKFVIEHEKAHLRQSNEFAKKGTTIKEEYFRNAPKDNKYMSKEALAIESAANMAALEKMGKIKINRKPKAKEVKVEEQQKKLVVKDTNQNVDIVPKKSKEIQEIEKLEEKVEGLRERAKKLFNETKTNWKTSYRTDGDYATYQRIHRQTRDALNIAAKAGADTKEYISDLFKANSKEIGGEFDKSFAKHVLYTDYSAIREFKTKSDAMAYLRDNRAIYAKAKIYIDQTAKGINDKGQMNHVDFTNNGYQIAQRAGLDPKKYGDTIDKLVSIKAMDDQSWSFIEKNGGSNLFESMVNMADVLRRESDEVFKDNPHAKVKGYMAETYDSIYRYEMKDGEFKRFIDAEVGMVQGGLPQRLDNSRIGEVRQFPKLIKNLSDKAKLEYAEANNLGVVLNQYAQPVAMRKVASEAQRLSINKSIKASDMILLTFENNVRKLVQRDGVINDIVNTKDNTLFSSKQQDGMIALSDDELSSIPRELRGKVAYVNKDFKHMLLGNKQIQKAEKQWSKITEQLLKDTVSHFKENVVLKNPASWANNMGYNFFVNMQEGISPAKTIMYMKKGLREKKRAEELVTRLTRLELDGKSGTKEYVSIEKELVDNLYYTMDRQGLAVTVMSNIMDSPIASKRLSDKMMKQATRKMLGDEMGDKVSNIVSNLYLSPQSKAGQAAMNMFGSIDAMGRYSMAAEQMAKGASLDDAIKKANGIYGDLDMIAPMWSQAIQQYGFIPFSNWYFRMSGGLTKSVMDNKVKAIGVAALLYGISEYTDKRTDSMNPLTSLVETPADMLIMSPYFNPINYARNVTTPAVYKKGYRAIESGDPLSVALTRDF